jgi:hypothetical protein
MKMQLDEGMPKNGADPIAAGCLELLALLVRRAEKDARRGWPNCAARQVVTT